MENHPTLLCLFDREDARQASCFAGADADWVDRTDHGRCRYVSALMDDEPDLGHLSATAAVIVIRPTLLSSVTGGRLGAWLAALEDEDLPVSLLATDAPVTAFAWLTKYAPRSLHCFRQDGAVEPHLPSWWRRHAESYLADPDQRGNAGDDSSTGQFSKEVLNRYLANRHLR